MYVLRLVDSQDETLGLVVVDHDGGIETSCFNEVAIQDADTVVATVLGRDDLGEFTLPLEFNGDDVNESISFLLEQQGQLIDL